MALMSKAKKPAAPKETAKPTPPVLYLRLTAADEAALQAYIEAQDTPPDRTAVGLRAVRSFLTERGFLTPTKSKPE